MYLYNLMLDNLAGNAAVQDVINEPLDYSTRTTSAEAVAWADRAIRALIADGVPFDLRRAAEDLTEYTALLDGARR